MLSGCGAPGPGDEQEAGLVRTQRPHRRGVARQQGRHRRDPDGQARGGQGNPGHSASIVEGRPSRRAHPHGRGSSDRRVFIAETRGPPTGNTRDARWSRDDGRRGSPCCGECGRRCRTGRARWRRWRASAAPRASTSWAAGVPGGRGGDRRAGARGAGRLGRGRHRRPGRAGRGARGRLAPVHRGRRWSTSRRATSRRRGRSWPSRPASPRWSRQLFDAEAEPIDDRGRPRLDGDDGRRRLGAGAPGGAVHRHRARARGRDWPSWSATSWDAAGTRWRCPSRVVGWAPGRPPSSSRRAMGSRRWWTVRRWAARCSPSWSRRGRRHLHLEVDPAWRRRGIGSRLLLEAARAAAGLGDDELVLVTSADNQAVLPMVLGLGPAWPDPDVRGRPDGAGAAARPGGSAALSGPLGWGSGDPGEVRRAGPHLRRRPAAAGGVRPGARRHRHDRRG